MLQVGLGVRRAEERVWVATAQFTPDHGAPTNDPEMFEGTSATPVTTVGIVVVAQGIQKREPTEVLEHECAYVCLYRFALDVMNVGTVVKKVI